MEKIEDLIGREIQFGDWEYGWMSSATVLSISPKGQRLRIQIHGAKKPSTITVKELNQGYMNSYKGHCPIILKKKKDDQKI